MGHLTRSISAALLCLLSAAAQAEAAPEGVKELPLYFWGVQRSDGSSDVEAAASVRQRLIEVGASLRSLPSHVAGLACTGADCPEKLADAEGFTGIPVVGAYLVPPVGQADTHVEAAVLWWLDTATGKLHRRRVSCQGQSCSIASRLAREAVILADHGPAAPAPECAAVQQSDTASDHAPTSPGILSTGLALSLTTTAGAKAPSKSLLAELQSGLLRLGVRTTIASPSGSSAASSGARLSIELQGTLDEKKPITPIQTIFLALSAPGVSRQMRLYCSPESCSRDLSRFLRVNISALLDGAEPEPPPFAVPCATLPPSDRKLASRDPGPVLLAQTEPVAQVAPLETKAVGKPPKPPVNLGLCATGWTLVAAGMGGAVAAGTVAAFDGRRVGGTCTEDGTGNRVPCIQQTLDLAKIIGGTSGGVFAVGAVLIGVATIRSGSEGFRCIQKNR